MFEEFIEENDLHPYQDDRGVENLKKIIDHLGYDNFGQSIIINFIRDNPGILEPMFDWIEENYSEKF